MKTLWIWWTKLMNKNLIKVILLFLAFIITIFLSVFLLFIDIDLIWKIFIAVIGVMLSVFEFITIQKINKNIPTKEVKETEELIEVEQEMKEYSTKHVLCPKCYKPFDGSKCFHCGFERK